MDRYDRRVRLFAAGLASLAGYVDACGFILSKGFFVSFMSGNSTRLAVGVAEALPDALAAGGLILAFLLGVTAGSLYGRAAGERRAAAVLLMIAALIAGAAVSSWAGYLHAALALTAFAMGAENAIFEQDGQVRIGLTYMTGSIVKLGQGLASAVSGGDRWAWLPYLLLWGGFVAGAVCGAAAAASAQSAALWIGSALALSFAIVAGSILDTGRSRQAGC
ncbi:DUF1275 family protein [Sphingomonas cannabina]|uniref:YoaK family protein n=1 Tax=Sphingomonas cannabina TaxID=2899123 RepID=UPI001F2D44A2|nr:DUF1275 family protein [Sphingomonas cannabina]UIJ46316.1 DUF1275 family protein [Sphingomonas cannabina]